MTDYLDEAAAELRKARESNERRFGLIPSLAAGNLATAYVLREVNDRRMDLAEGFTRLACVNEQHAVQRFSTDVLATLGSAEIAPPGDSLG